MHFQVTRERAKMTFIQLVIALALVAIFSLPSPIYTQANDNTNYYMNSLPELKFQTQVDNSTVIKQTGQQQIFKCQVRLAFTHNNNNNNNNQVRWSSRSINGTKLLTTSTTDWLSAPGASQTQLPANLSALTIDWLRDEQLLEPGAQVRVGDLDELVGVQNVALKSAGRQITKGNNNQNQNHQSNNKFARIEIKNTLNGNQLKLTSRLRLNHLRSADSAHYKCVARATFILPTTAASINNAADAIQQQQQQTQFIDVVDQTLESNSTRLLVMIGMNAAPASAESRDKKWNQKASGATSGRTLGKRPAGLQKHIHYSSTGAAAAGSQGNNEDVEPTTTTRQTNQADDSTRATSRTTTTTLPSNQLLFEDDEDLFRAPNGELINGQQQQQQQQQQATNDVDANNGGQIIAEWANTNSGGDNELPTTTTTAQKAPHFDWNLGVGGEQFDSDDDNTNRNHESPLGDDNNNTNTVTTTTTTLGSTQTTFNDAGHHSNELAKLVHRIAAAPELSCYTSRGEFYRGHAFTSSDSRPCLNWAHVRRVMNLSISFTIGMDDNHNYCRNQQQPQLQPRAAAAATNELNGPWCFVLYNEHLDGSLMLTSASRHLIDAARRSPLAISGRGRLVRVGVAGTNSNQQQPLLVVGRPCGVASCSEYLWLYIVAPPLGLMALFGCLITLAIKTLRRKSRNYHSIFSAAYKRHSNSSNSTASAASCELSPASKTNVMVQRILGNSSKSCKKRSKVQQQQQQQSKPVKAKSYLDDDIFEIVHDIDWSDGAQNNHHQTSLSPLSRESFDLNSPQGFGESQQQQQQQQQQRSTLKHSKSIVPMLIDSTPPPPPPRLASNMSKSKSQAGPMFATLRCHVRQSAAAAAAAANQQQRRHQVEALKQQANGLDWTTTSSSLNHQPASNTTDQQKPVVKTGHLISCSSSSSSCNVGGIAQGAQVIVDQQQQQVDSTAASILASELQQIESSNVNCVPMSETSQPIYEGKFSQVLMAYLKQNDQDRTQATGKIGAQVAVCALKQQATLDCTSVFQANKLRVRNLNHLNLLKLIGCVQYDDHCGGLLANNNEAGDCDLMGPPKSTCGLIYDMAHLIDLSDWLKEQSKEALVAQVDDTSGELSLRQNLTCIAKQIALGLDYLHDKNLLFKDLACRNCFLDVTRMLVKLASFNIELEFGDNNNNSISDQQQKQNNGLSASTSNCDLTTTTTTTTSGSEIMADDESNIISGCNTTSQTNDNSRILNLKSMVRPKYLLDYYVIDSRPSECQLLPLSWIPLESILFNKFNKQTDIWSFGCLLYELFSLGEVAYFGYSSKQVIDSVRSNLMPPQPRLCPNGIYKLMCKCLSDIPTLRPNIKHIYEQLNLYSGQCSSFMNHHLCII